MSQEQHNNEATRYAWAMLGVGMIVLVLVFVWRWHSAPVATMANEAETSSSDAAGNTAGRITPAIDRVVAAPPPMMGDMNGLTNLLDRDPGIVERQVKILEKQAATAAKSKVGPSPLVLTPERIRAIERKGLILE